MANYQNLARQKAKKYGLDPNVFGRQIQQESGYNPGARSPAGAQGIAQIMPATAKGWGVNPSDPVASLDAAAKNMASYVKQFGSYDAALRAYNAGPGNIGKSKGFAETNQYVKNILNGSTPKVSGNVGAPATTSPSSYGAAPGTDKRALALSLLGMGGYGGGDPLTLALQQATQQAPKAAPAPTGSYGSAPTGQAVNGLVPQVVKALAFARAHGWKGQVNSGYRSDAEQLKIWNSGVRPAAKPKALGGSGSNHSSGQAVDVSDVAGFARAMAQAPRSIRLYNRVPNDALHFSVTGH